MNSIRHTIRTLLRAGFISALCIIFLMSWTSYRNAAFIVGFILLFGIFIFLEREITRRIAVEEEFLARNNEALDRMVNERTNQLIEAHAQLSHAKRIMDIGRLSATIAHELRNPLSAIKLAVYNIQRKVEDPQVDRHLANIRKKVLESDQIISNLLSFSRIQAAHFEPVKLCDALRDCVATVSSKYVSPGITITEHFDCTENDTINADSTQFKMLFSNILDNAYQALAGKQGNITIAVRKDNASAWKISISDTGEGMDAQELDKIFEPFYTTKAKGTGLGLAVCKEIVEMHGGSIEVQSAKGQGTTFTITLPMRRPAASPAATLA